MLFPHCCPVVRRIHRRVPFKKDSVSWISYWTNNRITGELRRHYKYAPVWKFAMYQPWSISCCVYTLQYHKSACHNGCFKVPHPTTPHPNYPHYCGVIMGAMTSQITSLNIFCSTAYSGADQRKHQRSTLLVFVWRIHRWPINSPYKCPVTRKMLPFDDVIMAQNQSFFYTKCVVMFCSRIISPRRINGLWWCVISLVMLFFFLFHNICGIDTLYSKSEVLQNIPEIHY